VSHDPSGRTAPNAAVDPTVEQARAYFEEFAAEYEAAALESGWRLNGRLAETVTNIGTVRAAVDLACGTGETLAGLAAVLPDAALTGVDLAQAMVDLAVARVPRATVIRGDLRRFAEDAAEGQFDLVTAVGGFEFLPDLPGLLQSVRRLVAPGGHLVFTFEPVLAGWSPQEQRSETNLGSNGRELTTFRWEPGEITAGFEGWDLLRSELLTAYQRDELPTVYAWLHYRHPDAALAHRGWCPPDSVAQDGVEVEAAPAAGAA